MNCRQLSVGVDSLIRNQQRGIDSSREPYDSLADRLWRSYDSADKGAGFISERVLEWCWRWCQQTGWKPSVQSDASSLWLCSFWSSLLFSIHPSLALSFIFSLCLSPSCLFSTARWVITAVAHDTPPFVFWDLPTHWSLPLLLLAATYTLLAYVHTCTYVLLPLIP